MLPPEVERISQMTMDDVTGGRTGPPPNEPDAHGQAALLLAESILHALIETSVLTIDEAVDVVATAAEVKVEVATLAGESNRRMQESLNLLTRIRQSLTSGAV